MTKSEIIHELATLANYIQYKNPTVEETVGFIDAIRNKIEQEEVDFVNHPPHYTQGSIECIQAMESAYGKEAVMNYCACNAFKYQWRFNNKNGEEDIKKCQWYQNKYLELKHELDE